ncbi:MAG: hypothetical protein E7K04_02895 [Helicobacter sp.]|nr:hypothetical protein [Helicobacter sp.]
MALFEALFKPLFSKVFILIYADNSTCSISVLRFKQNKLIEKISKEFKIPSRVISTEAIKYIKKYQKRYPFSYIGALNNMPNQGAFGEDFIDQARSDVESFKDSKELATIMLKDFGVFVSHADLEAFQKNYSRLNGLDYVFSPFLLLHKIIESRLNIALKMYVLCEKTNLTILVANGEGIYFGSYFDLEDYAYQKKKLKEQEAKDNEIQKSEESEDEKEELELDDDFYDDSDFDDDIEDLDLDVLQKAANENKVEIPKEMQQAALQAQQLSEILQNTLRDFYDLGGDFIEEILLFDATDITQENLSKIQDSMLMDISREEVNIKHQLSLLIINEYKAANEI